MAYPRSMSPSKAARILATAGSLIASAMLPACGGAGRSDRPEATSATRKNVQEVDPAAVAFTPKAGQTIYVPVYSAVSISDRPHVFNLAINLSIRNTDLKRPIVLKSARYYDDGGTLVQEFAPRPLKIGALASVHFYVGESDKAGGRGACFLVDWVAEDSVTDALAESVMVGTANTQGVSFTNPGHVLSDLRRP